MNTTEEQISVKEWKERVLNLCQKPGVSMAEISRMPNAGGGGNLTSGTCQNIILWDGIQRNLADAISQLLADAQIEVRSSSPLIYLIDGASLRLPIAKQHRNYKTPHWLPVVINLL